MKNLNFCLAGMILSVCLIFESCGTDPVDQTGKLNETLSTLESNTGENLPDSLKVYYFDFDEVDYYHTDTGHVFFPNDSLLSNDERLFQKLFEYEFQYGNAATALKDPYTVVLTRKAANKLFDDENPVGKGLKVGKYDYTVTGVLKETDNKSHIVFEGLASLSSLKTIHESEKNYRDDMENWTNFWNGWTYILLEPGKTEVDIQEDLDKIY